MSYDKVWIDGYTESGAPLLTQSVQSRSSDSLLGGKAPIFLSAAWTA